MRPNFAVIGNPIEHSLSPDIHQYFAQQTKRILSYEKILGDEQCFAQQVSDFFATGGKGLNITLPFKQQAFALAAAKSNRCSQAGAANTLWMDEQRIWADNTDGVGLIRDLTRYTAVEQARILILGAGGAVRGIIAPLLAEKPAQLMVANRSFAPLPQLQLEFPQISCSALNSISGLFDIVINATSASLLGAEISLPESLMSAGPFCYDLAYQLKCSTAFVRYAKALGCTAVDGLGMLVEQAAESFYLWHDVRPDTQEVLHALRTRLA